MSYKAKRYDLNNKHFTLYEHLLNLRIKMSVRIFKCSWVVHMLNRREAKTRSVQSWMLSPLRSWFHKHTS